MKQIVQCVPNFSEGRDLDIISKIIKPLENQEGFKLISVEPDKDYNRTVVTLIGDPQSMIKPLLNFIEKAKQFIDMNHQKGEHPRMGAVDVIPFIPISNITMDDCIEYANTCAKQVNSLFDIPVFLYAQAANQPSRINLPEIRKGEFEGMTEKIKDPFWAPDYGKPEIHQTFGVLAIGARLPLIAYNIDLDTEDQKVASHIAKAIRGSSGGFQYVQAGPAYLEERKHMQVTMNILDHKKNPIYRIFETVKMEAKRFNVSITSSEIIGLCPLDALHTSLRYYFLVDGLKFSKEMNINDSVENAIKYLKLRDFDQQKIIESYI